MQVHSKPISTQCESELSPDEYAAATGFMKAHAHMQKNLYSDLQCAHGLLPSEYDILFGIIRSETKSASMSDLAVIANLSISGMSRLAVRLEDRGLVMRKQNPHDGRGWNLQITEAGADLMDAAKQTHIASLRAHFLQYFDEREVAQMVRLWSRLPVNQDTCSS